MTPCKVSVIRGCPNAGEVWGGVVERSGEWLGQAAGVLRASSRKWMSAPLILCISSYIYFNGITSPPTADEYQFMKRVFLFLATNFAILIVLGIALSILMPVLGIDSQSNAGLLLFCAVFGMGGSFVSLAMSKWMPSAASGL